ncbi:hypothetical protein ACLB1M_28075 [Escherichia coli]
MKHSTAKSVNHVEASVRGKETESTGLLGNGWRDATNSRAPVKTPADLKGLKLAHS